MAITLIDAPGTMTYTGNPVIYGFEYTSQNVNWKLQLAIMDTATASIIATQLYPFTDVDGSMKVNIAEILNARYSYLADLPTGSDPILCSYLNKYSVKWRVIKPNVIPGSYAFEPDAHYAIKGGIGMMDSYNNYRVNRDSYYIDGSFLPRVRPTADLQGHFMTNMWRETRHLQPDEQVWLLYMNRYNAAIKVKYVVNYLDNTDLEINKVLTATGAWDESAWWVPVGIDQCHLDPTGKGIYDYSVTVYDLAETVDLTAVQVIPDYRPDYRGMCLYWRNSYGGIDHVKLRGVRQTSVASEAKEYLQPLALGYDPAQVVGTNPYYDGKVRPKWKGNTGYLPVSISTGMMDLLTKKGAWLFVNGSYLPVRISSTDVVTSTTEDKLRNVVIEFEAANNFSNFPPYLFESI